MTLSSDSFNQNPTGPTRGLGSEARIERVLGLARGVFERHGTRVAAWASEDLARLPEAVRADGPWQRRARELDDQRADGLQFLTSQEALLKRAREAKLPHERQQGIYAVQAELAQAMATGFLEELQALARLAGVDLATLPARPSGEVSRRVPQPEAPPPKAGLGDMVRRFTLGREPREAATSDPGEVLKRVVHEAGEAIAGVRKVYDYTAERINYVEQAVTVRERPVLGEESLRVAAPRVREVVGSLAILFQTSPQVYRRCQVAIGQTTAVRRGLLAAELGLRRLRMVPPTQLEQAAAALDLAALRGKAVPLANFPHTFEGDPILRQLFPLQRSVKPR